MARMIPLDGDDAEFPRLNTKITRKALAMLLKACRQREKLEPRPCPQGVIIAELIYEHLDELTPEEERAEMPAPVRKKAPRVERKRRGRPPKTADAISA